MAEVLAYRRPLRACALGVFTGVVVGVVLGTHCVTVAAGAVLALGYLTGVPFWLALSYLAVIAAALLHDGWCFLRALRATTGQPGSPGLPATWKEGFARFTSSEAWRWRALTAPLAVLTGVYLAHQHLPASAVAVVATALWLIPDLTRLVGTPALIQLQHVAPLLQSPGSGDHSPREP